MEPWVTQDGYPVVTIERGYNAAVQGIMRATQVPTSKLTKDQSIFQVFDHSIGAILDKRTNS